MSRQLALLRPSPAFAVIFLLVLVHAAAVQREHLPSLGTSRRLTSGDACENREVYVFLNGGIEYHEVTRVNFLSAGCKTCLASLGIVQGSRQELVCTGTATCTGVDENGTSCATRSTVNLARGLCLNRGAVANTSCGLAFGLVPRGVNDYQEEATCKSLGDCVYVRSTQCEATQGCTTNGCMYNNPAWIGAANTAAAKRAACAGTMGGPVCAYADVTMCASTFDLTQTSSASSTAKVQAQVLLPALLLPMLAAASTTMGALLY